jgi:aldehyde dehydrogenase (NAD+)
MTPAEEARGILASLGVAAAGSLESRSPIDGRAIGSVAPAGAGEVDAACARARGAFLEWRLVPAPRRGALVRLLGDELRAA